ncbi:MAG: phospholipase C [Nitrososphaerales archaeon]
MHKRILALALLFFLTASSFVPNFSSAQTANPIKHIIFILQENHSFDNYFGTYPGANNLSFAPPCCPTLLSATAQPAVVKPFHLNVSQPIDIVGDELPPGQMYPNASDVLTASSGNVAPFQLPTESSLDLQHSWQAAHTDWNNGSMNGFVVGEANNQTMGYYTRSDIPYYFDYANNYVLDDNFYSSLLGPSFPNHLYMVSGTSGNITGNPKSHGPDFTLSQYFNLTWTQIAQELTQAGVSWKWYTGQANVTAPSYWDVLPVFSYFQKNPQLLKANVVGTQNFLGSVQNGTLPSVSWIIPGSAWRPPTAPFTNSPSIQNCVTSEHPPARPDCGMDYVSYLVNAVMNSPYWSSTAIVINWDDYGGFYDHVSPPQEDAFGEGFRVPTLVISPWAKHGYVDHTPYEFGSFLSLIETNFNVPSLGTRDSFGIGKNNMMNSFNFAQAPQPVLIEPGTFVGPGNSPPLSNGYTGGGTTTSTSGASSTSLASSSSVITGTTSSATGTQTTGSGGTSSSSTASTTSTVASSNNIPLEVATVGAVVVILGGAIFLYFRRMHAVKKAT